MNSFWQYEFIDVIVFTQEISIFPFNQSRSTRNIFFPCNESRNTSNFVRGITPTNIVLIFTKLGMYIKNTLIEFFCSLSCYIL